MDQSNLDKKYLLDSSVFNCHYCKRRNVSYDVEFAGKFHWSEEDKRYVYLVRCTSCDCVGMFMSKYYWSTSPNYPFKYSPSGWDVDTEYDENSLDELFYYQHPSNDFFASQHVPKKIRDLINEASSCLKMNFLVGASGALRKAIYEFLLNSHAEGSDYEQKIKSLKIKYPKVDPQYFDSLSSIKKASDVNLHENADSWVVWDKGDLDFLFKVMVIILDEVYESPERRKSDLLLLKSLAKKAKTKVEIALPEEVAVAVEVDATQP